MTPTDLLRPARRDRLEREGRLQGQQDIPLNALGRVQAEEAGAGCAALVRTLPASTMWRAPMHRTRETMERLREAMGLWTPRTTASTSASWNSPSAEWEGLTWKDVRKAEPQSAAARERDKWNYVPPGGESYAMLAERVRPVLDGSPATRWSSAMAASPARSWPACGVHARQAASIDIWQGRVLVIEVGTITGRKPRRRRGNGVVSRVRAVAGPGLGRRGADLD